MGIIEAMKTLSQELKQLYREAPRYVGNLALQHFNDNFQQQGFVDDTLQPWPPRHDDGGQDRAILVKTGRLRRSLRISRLSTEEVVIGTDVPYAKVHNEGGMINVKAHNRRSKRGNEFAVRAYIYKATQRKFIGASKQLDRKIENYFTDRVEAITNKIDSL
jgi:phage gpG-like protein